MSENDTDSCPSVFSARWFVLGLLITVTSVLTACGFESEAVTDKSTNQIKNGIEVVSRDPTLTLPGDRSDESTDDATPTEEVTHTPLPPSPTLTATSTPIPATATPVVYSVQAGDTLAAIAQRFGVSVDAILAANSISNPDSLTIGDELVIPGQGGAEQAEQAVAQADDAGEESTTEEPATGGSEVDSDPGEGINPNDTPIVIEVPEVDDDSAVVHYVAEGETLSGIADQYTISLEALLMANGLPGDAQLMAGEPLVIPKGTPTPAPTRTPTPAPIEPTPTETPVSLESLSAPGDSSRASPTATPTATYTPIPPTATPVIYQVQRGDTPGRIAARYGITSDELLAANPDVNAFRLQVGDELVIPSDAEEVPTPAPTATPTLANMVYATHVVADGETLDTIAEAYDTSADAVKGVNAALADAAPATGDTIRIPLGTATPTPTPTAIATRTPTPGPKYVAPIPISPKGKRPVYQAEPVLSWASTGVLEPDEFYAVRVRFAVNGKAIKTESFQTRRTSLRLSDDLDLPFGRLIQVRWDVLVMRKDSSTTKESIGEAMSALSTTAEFYWRWTQ